MATDRSKRNGYPKTMRSTQLATIPRKPTPKQNLPGLPYEPLLFAAEVMVVEASREEIQRFLSGFNYNDQVLQCGFLSTNPPPLAEPSTSDAVGKRLDDKIGVIWNCCDGKMEHSSYSSF